MCTNPRKIIIDKEEYTVKCGKCDTCRRNLAQEWAIKLIKESQYHKESCFITLTFDNKILTDKSSRAYKMGANAGFVFNIEYSKKYFTKFIKRLRKHYKDKYISYFHVAEYGEKNGRPHHHCILFGINFKEDRKEMEVSKTGHIQYTSKTLLDLWACGRVSIQDCNNNNIIYTAQYSLKKFKSKDEKHKSYFTFSNRCKMNVKWVRRNPEQIKNLYLNDSEGKKYRIPRSYLYNLSKEKNNIYEKYYLEYEDKIGKFITECNQRERIKDLKNKEKIRELRNINHNKWRNF